MRLIFGRGCSGLGWGFCKSDGFCFWGVFFWVEGNGILVYAMKASFSYPGSGLWVKRWVGWGVGVIRKL